MSVITKRLPTGRVEYYLENAFGKLKRVTSTNTSHLNEFHWPDYGATNEAFEEVALDDIEVDTSDTTPLVEETSFSATPGLAEAGGISAAAGAASAPTATAFGAGVGITLGSIAVGTAIGTLNQDEHKDPVVSLPDHRYIGPGNTVDDTEPVDVDDSIAKEHDINYEKAKTQEDVQEADKQGADEFLSDVIDNNNLHSVAGYIGLKAKEKIESVIGVQYPSNLPSISGMSHSRVVRALGKYPIDKDPRKHNDFPQRHEFSPLHYVGRVKYIWEQWNHARQNRGLPRVDPPSSLGIAVTMRPKTDKKTGVRADNKSITFPEWQKRNSGKAGPLIEAFRAGRPFQNTTVRTLLDTAIAHDISESERLEVEAILKSFDSGSISIADFDNSGGAGPSNAPQNVDMMDTRGVKRTNDGVQGGSGTPSNPAEAIQTADAKGTGHNSGSDGGFDSAQGPVSFLPKGGYSAKGGMMRFTKVHRMKSWAVPYFKLASTVHGGSNLVTTPLAKIPWEYAFFYLSPEEFNLLPAGSYIDSVHIKIMQTVASTGYPTGSTTSTIATTNHPKVLVIGKDLEAKSRGGVDRALNFSSSMVPSFSDTPDMSSIYDDFIAKQYGTDQTALDSEVVIPGAAHKIPYYNKGHFCIYQPNRAQALANGFFTETDGTVTANYSPGFEYFSNYITELNSNDTTWDFVDSMSYKFTSAPIGEQYKALELLTSTFDQNTGSQNQYFNSKRNVSGTLVNGDTKFTESIRPSQRSTIPIVNYKTAPMEYGAYFIRGDKAGKPSRQPSYHIGMRAIDKLDPELNETRAPTFVQANIEFEIEATMMVNLPSYPNRFMRPKFFNTSIENAVQGIDANPSYGPERFVTFGLYDEIGESPPLAAIDTEDNEPNEEGMLLRRNRVKRSVPNISSLVSRKRK